MIVCPTCGGSGDEMQDSASALGIPGGWVAIGPCPDCVEGLVVSDELVEAKAEELHRQYCVDGCRRPLDDTWRDFARTVLVAQITHLTGGS